MAFVLPSPVLHSTPRCQSVHRCKHQKSLNIGRIRCSSTNSNEGSSTQGSSSSDLKTIDSVEDRSNGVPPPSTQTENVLERRSSGQRRQADSTDWVASQLTRRFGIAGGLAWLGILTVGVVGEQIKTRLEEQAEIDGTKVGLPLLELLLLYRISLVQGFNADKLSEGCPVQSGRLFSLQHQLLELSCNLPLNRTYIRNT
eukprot:jgi/Botrbrau1/11699/Bobra.0195s0030.1